MHFKEVVGQQELIEKMLHLVQHDHLPHALMISGREGSGGMPLALATAQYILCTDRKSDDACGECSSCTKMKKLQHPDLHFSFPTYNKQGSQRPPVSNDFIREFREFMLANPYGNDTEWLKFLNTEKQGNITATECREIIQKLQLRSFESEYKVLIMWYPEYLDKEGNILLKLIEEPTDKTLLFFVTSDLESILPTIQSRTQLFPLKKLLDEEVKDALIKRGVPDDKATLYARISEGNFHQALSLVNQESDDWLLVLRNWFNCLYAYKGLDLVNWVHEIDERSKEDKKNFLEYVMQLLEHLIRYRQLKQHNMVLLDAEQKILDVLISKGLNDYRINEMVQLLNESIFQIERNANTKILFHALSLRIQSIVHQKQVMTG